MLFILCGIGINSIYINIIYTYPFSVKLNSFVEKIILKHLKFEMR